MKTLIRLLLACVALLLLAGQVMAQKQAFVPDHILVKPAKGVNDAQLKALFAGHGASQIAHIKQIDVRVLKVSQPALEKVLEALSRDNRVEFAEKDYIAQAVGTANDPYYTSGQEWYLGKIQAPSAWDITTGTSSLVVAVIDTGANYSHPDLQGKLLAGYDFVNSDTDPNDDNGHGTGTSGIVGANSNNSTGMASVAWNVSILPLKVLDASGSGSYSNIAMAINYAADNGARIINMSLGGTYNSSTVQSAVNYAWSKGVVLIAAAGNNGNSTTFYPAACNNVVAVAATDSTDTRTSWSNYGSYVDLSAPGANILTTYNSGYSSVNGTSFSSPITAGIAALVASVQPSLSNSQIVDVLLKNSDDIGAAGYDVYYGYGRVNAYRAVAAASSYFNVDTTAPSVTIGSPQNGATLSGTVSITATATDNVGVSKMEVLIDGVVVGQSASASVSYSWNSLSYTNATHTIQVRAYDAANNIGSSSASVTVQNNVVADTTAPTVAITSPRDGAILSSNQKISVSATDNVRVTRLELYIDGQLVGSTTSSSTTWTWNTSKVARGQHNLQALAYDAAGNTGSSTVVRVYK